MKNKIKLYFLYLNLINYFNFFAVFILLYLKTDELKFCISAE